MQRRNFVLGALSAPLVTRPFAAQADTKVRTNSRPIRLIVPFAAGGPVDATMRILAEHVRHELGPIVVENRGGVGGNLGVAELARAAPDGLTIGVATTATHAVNPWLYSQLPFNAERDFSPIIRVARTPNVLVMHAEYARLARIRTVADLITLARQRPGQLNFGSGGNGSAGHLAAELFKHKANFYAVHIPYRGAAPAQLALMSGEVDFNIDNLAAASAGLHSGRLVALAVTSPKPEPLLPGVPPLAETVPGFDIDTWWGLVAPRGTSVETVYRLNDAFARALQDKAVQERFAALWLTPAPSSPQEFAAFIHEQRSRYRDIVRNSGAKVD